MQTDSLMPEISATTRAATIPGLTAPDDKWNHFQRRKEENWQMLKMLIMTITNIYLFIYLFSPLINEKRVGGSLISQAAQQVAARYQGHNLVTERYNLRHPPQSWRNQLFLDKKIEFHQYLLQNNTIEPFVVPNAFGVSHL